MSLYFKIILVIFGLAYFISPVDVIPDLLLPYIGWIDDGLVFATIIYMIRYGRLPNFLFNKKNPSQPPKDKTKTNNTPHSNNKARQKAGSNYGSNSDQKSGSNSQYSKKSSPPPKQKTLYEILGVKENASKREIQVGYKEAIKKYHPDKLSHLGEEFSTLANEKFLEIQTAYETLIKKF
ncbi:MAG: DnaJ domain-containing protein [Desulfobacula sp.]|nr:DnaJ domain-containing protein [Desulfobacula sp.]